jgi:GDPmannose 4,6-dehydratase
MKILMLFQRKLLVMFQQEKPDDYVVATGVKRTVRDFVNYSFNELGIELQWKGEGVEEKGTSKSTGKILVEVDPKYFRPAEVELLIGDPTKAKEKN